MNPSGKRDQISNLPMKHAFPHLLMLTAIFFVTFLARIVLAPLLPSIQAELSLDYRDAGHLFLVISAGYFIALLSTGYLAARYQHRTMIMASCAGIGLALFSASMITSLSGLRAMAFFIGLAAGLYLPSGISAVTHLTRPQHWGRALAIHELAPNLAFILAPVAAELILGISSWRSGLTALGVIALLLGLLYMTHGRGTSFHGQMPDRLGIQYLLKQSYLWMLVALFSLGITSTLGIYAMLPLFLVTTHGMESGHANTLLAISRVAALPMALTGGWMADRFGPLRTLRVVFLLTGLTTMALGLTEGRWLQGAVFCQPLLAVCFFPAGFSILSALSPTGYRNITVSLTIPAAFLIGGGAIPLLIGWFGDAHHFALAFILTGVMITSGAVLTVRLPQPPR